VPRSVGASLDEYLASQGLLGMRTLGEIVACWAAVVGEDVAAHAQPRLLDGTELVVGVDHPGWATQLGFLSATICDRLADQLGYRAVERLRTHVDARFRLE
jgi:predicted nucleic acid-binding Zn ribbon protein